jgi:hypothetical protein
MAFNAILTTQYLHHRFIACPERTTLTTRDSQTSIARKLHAAA